MKTGKFLRISLILGAALFGSACILQSAAPTAQIIVVTATEDGSLPLSSTQTPDAGAAPTMEPTWTLTLLPSLTHTPTTAPLTMSAGQALSCVKGPDWKLYEWVAGIAKGETVTLVARAVPEIPDYYVVRKADGKECWAFGGSSIISGSTASLPIRETPPLPTVNFVVQNHVYIELCEVLIRKTGEAAWGADRLTVPNIAKLGEFTLSITAGYYDVRVRDCRTSTLYEEYNRAIGSDNTYRILEIAVDVDFSIRNNWDFAACHINLYPSPLPTLSLYDHEIDGGPFAVGTTKNFTARAGYYSIQLLACDHHTDSMRPFYIHPGMGVLVFGYG